MSERLPLTRQIGVADAIRYLRDRKNLSARAASLMAGLSSSYVGKLEAGELAPSFRAFARLALVLEMSSQEMLFCVIQEGMFATSPFEGTFQE